MGGKEDPKGLRAIRTIRPPKVDLKDLKGKKGKQLMALLRTVTFSKPSPVRWRVILIPPLLREWVTS